MKSNATIFSEMLWPYLDNELSDESKKLLEQELKTNEDLKKQLDNLILSTSIIRNYGLRTRVNSIHKEMMAELAPARKLPLTTKSTNFQFYILRIAAALILMPILYIAYLYLSVREDTILEDKYTPYRMSVTRGEENNVIRSLYIEKNYTKLIEAIGTVNSQEINDLFLTAQAYFATKDFKKAAEYFDKVNQRNIQEKTNLYHDDIEYYTALCNLKIKNTLSAYTALKSIQNNKQHLYSDKISIPELIKLKIYISQHNLKN